jgi:hypothetical protein
MLDAVSDGFTFFHVNYGQSLTFFHVLIAKGRER